MVARGADGQNLELCRPPCLAILTQGRYEFGAAYKRRDPVWSGRAFDVEASEQLTVDYKRRIRALGILPLIAGPALATLIFAWSVIRSGPLESRTDRELRTSRIAEAAAFFGGLALSIWLFTRRDEVTVHVGGRTGDKVVPQPIVEEAVVLTDSDLVRRVFACTEASVRRLEISVDLDPSNKVIAARTPDAFGRGARACMRQALLGGSVDGGTDSTRRLIIDR